MKAVVVALCVCLLLAHQADAQTGLAGTIINACTSGMTSSVCKGAMSRGTALCKSPNGSGNCIKMVTDICQVL